MVKPCEWLGKACGGVFEYLEDVFERPFSCCVFFMALTNFAPLLASLIILALHYTTDCSEDLSTYLMIGSCLMLIHVAMAVYVFRQVSMHEEGWLGESPLKK